MATGTGSAGGGWPTIFRRASVGIPVRGSRERRSFVAGSMSPAPTEGGLKQARPGSGSADNRQMRPGSGSADNRQMRPGSGSADNPSESQLSAALVDNPPAGAELGFYVHVPFCAKRCGYCSFNTAPLEDGAMARYLEALHREIDLLGAIAWSRRVRLSTIFPRGGTPSPPPPPGLAAMLERVPSRIEIPADAEITVECNPESATREKLAGYRAARLH